MAGSRLQLLFLCYRDSGDSLLLKHNGHLSPRGVIQIQYQLKVIPILFSPALQHIYCCAVQLKALPGPGAARRAPACASLAGGFGTLPAGYNVEDAGQRRLGSARPGSGRCRPAAGAAEPRAPPSRPLRPRGPHFPRPVETRSPAGRLRRRVGSAGDAGVRPSVRPPLPQPGFARGERGASRGKRRQRAGIFPRWKRGGFVPNFVGAAR